jgi:hypothetical protein
VLVQGNTLVLGRVVAFSPVRQDISLPDQAIDFLEYTFYHTDFSLSLQVEVHAGERDPVRLVMLD